jgi:crotonobetainyl-CoA:carnitine CoA-transferase CaiB-like acyl-CoA transferase
MDRLGLGFDALAATNPRLIYCAITGYGQDGPYRDLVGHDINYVGYAGVLSLAVEPGGMPILPGVQIGDLGGGMLGAIGVLAALAERERSGRGRFLDVSMLDGVVSWLSIHAGAYFATGQTPVAGAGPLSGGYACYRVYRAKDGRFLTVGALEPQFWKALCEAVGCPELVDDQYAPAERQEEMAGLLQAVFLSRTREEWLAFLRDVPACVGPVNDVAEAMADPQVRHRGMVAEIDGVPVGPGPAVKARGASERALRRAPGFGEHTAEVLAGVGVGPDELAALRAGGVV